MTLYKRHWFWPESPLYGNMYYCLLCGRYITCNIHFTTVEFKEKKDGKTDPIHEKQLPTKEG